MRPVEAEMDFHIGLYKNVTRMQMRIVCLFSFLFILSTPVIAQVVNIYPVTIGDRAFGFGGAFTAQANDATAGWYNPAGLGFIDRTYINATGNVYSYDKSQSEKYISIEPTSGTSGYADLEEKQYRATPTTFAISKSLGKVGTLGFGVYVPRDTGIDDTLSTDVNYDSLIGPASENYYEYNSFEARSLYFGPSYGVRLNDHFSVGVSAFLLYSFVNQDSVLDIVTTENTADINILSLTSITSRKASYWGTRFSLGTKGEFNNLRIGVNIFTPTIRLSEKTEQTLISSQSSDIFTTTRSKQVTSVNTSDTGRGWGFATGVGWVENGSWAAELDVTYYKHKFTRDIAQRDVTNIQVGGEYNLTSRWLLRGGLFTDFSARPGISDPPEQNDPNYSVDIYGTTLQLAHKDHIANSKVMRSISVGLRYAIGNGSAQGLLDNPNTSEVVSVKRDLKYKSIGIMLGGMLSY
jgi:long-subunit fatty acid transport protein